MHGQGSNSFMPSSDPLPFAYQPHVIIDQATSDKTVLVEQYEDGANLPVQWRII